MLSGVCMMLIYLFASTSSPSLSIVSVLGFSCYVSIYMYLFVGVSMFPSILTMVFVGGLMILFFYSSVFTYHQLSIAAGEVWFLCFILLELGPYSLSNCVENQEDRTLILCMSLVLWFSMWGAIMMLKASTGCYRSYL